TAEVRILMMLCTSNLQTPMRCRSQIANGSVSGALADVNAYGARSCALHAPLRQDSARRKFSGARRHG
ncbi:MAG TPA: hypothetical protein VL048_10530, partial [Xanthobacteraceae bacterium]|nr:hypothetical protein [Xanthobacteraceae bacterium]